MANQRLALLDPQITINNEIIQIVPNSATLILGLGEDSVEVVSSGNDNTDVVVGSNTETQKAKLTFGIKNTQNTMNQIKGFKQLKSELTISIAEKTFNAIIRNGTIINDPEFTFTNDSNITVELEGRTAK